MPGKNHRQSVVQFHEDTISIDLHIMVDHGVNLAAVGASIISESAMWCWLTGTESARSMS
ncbi:MAG: hypothetical protein ACLU9S_24115 [Oscillospiraceae bacterium]